MFTPLPLLVAEDDENDLVLLQVAFAAVGESGPVRVVRDGQELMDYLQGIPPFHDRSLHPRPRLLLLDICMPKRNGFEVLEWLLPRPELRPRFVVVLTASRNPEHQRQAIHLGADSHLVKPQDLRGLVSLVKSLAKYWEKPLCPVRQELALVAQLVKVI